MEQFNSLSQSSRIAIVGGIVAVLVFLVFWMTMMRGPSYKTIATTDSSAQADAWEWGLSMENNPPKTQVTRSTTGKYELQVLDKNNDVNYATAAIDPAGARGHFVNTVKKCKEAGALGGMSAQRAHEDCVQRAHIHVLIRPESGVLENS
jgi:hypothetical protein